MTNAKLENNVAHLVTKLPGPRAAAILERDARSISSSYTRSYPFVAKSGRGALAEDVDGNTFLDFAAGIAVVSTGHCHPHISVLQLAGCARAGPNRLLEALPRPYLVDLLADLSN